MAGQGQYSPRHIGYLCHTCGATASEFVYIHPFFYCTLHAPRRRTMHAPDQRGDETREPEGWEGAVRFLARNLPGRPPADG